MVFESSNYIIDFVKEPDHEAILNIYNSNTKFLKHHMDREAVDQEWLLEELQTMKEAHFVSCKITSKTSKEIVGFLDFKIRLETYLSLLMIDNDNKGQGIGTEVYKAFEAFVFKQSKTLRIDVISNYDKSVIAFWEKQGFEITDRIKLNWNEKVLPAVVMKKHL